jgi:hypothetical protein
VVCPALGGSTSNAYHRYGRGGPADPCGLATSETVFSAKGIEELQNRERRLTPVWMRVAIPSGPETPLAKASSVMASVSQLRTIGPYHTSPAPHIASCVRHVRAPRIDPPRRESQLPRGRWDFFTSSYVAIEVVSQGAAAAHLQCLAIVLVGLICGRAQPKHPDAASSVLSPDFDRINRVIPRPQGRALRENYLVGRASDREVGPLKPDGIDGFLSPHLRGQRRNCDRDAPNPKQCSQSPIH